jgi:hypothetical protein
METDSPSPSADEASPAPMIITAGTAAPRSTIRPRSDKPPKFGVAHLLLWVGCAAVYLALLRFWSGAREGSFRYLVVFLPLVPFTAAAWAGLLIFVSRRLRDQRWPIEPGEWLVAIFGIREAVNSIQFVAINALPRYFPLELLTCSLPLVPTLSRKVAWRWKAFFYLLMIPDLSRVLLYELPKWLNLEPGALHLSSYWEEGARFAWIAGSILIVSWLAHRAGERYSWLHWVGLVICVAMGTNFPVVNWGLLVRPMVAVPIWE